MTDRSEATYKGKYNKLNEDFKKLEGKYKEAQKHSQEQSTKVAELEHMIEQDRNIDLHNKAQIMKLDMIERLLMKQDLNKLHHTNPQLKEFVDTLLTITA